MPILSGIAKLLGMSDAHEAHAEPTTAPTLHAATRLQCRFGMHEWDWIKVGPRGHQVYHEVCVWCGAERVR